MTSEAPPPPADRTGPASEPRRRFTTPLALVVVGLLLLAVLLIFLIGKPVDNQVVWLTRAKFAQASRPGLLTRLRQKVMSNPAIAKLLGRYRRIPPSIKLASSVMALSPAAVEIAGLGKPTAIQPNGMRAWILPALEWTALIQRLKTNSGASVFAQSTILTLDAMQAQTMIAYVKNPADPTYVTHKSTIITDFLPRAAAGSISVAVDLRAVGLGGMDTPAPPFLVTNLSVACLAIIPTGSGLVLDCGSLTSNYGTNCWFFLTPAILKPAPSPPPLPAAGALAAPPARQ